MACNMSRMNLSNTSCDSLGVWEWENFLFNISPRALRRQTLKICWRWLWYALSAELEFCIQKYFAFNLPTNFTLKFFISVRQSNKSITPECLGIPRHDDFLERHKKSKVVFAVEEEKNVFMRKVSSLIEWDVLPVEELLPTNRSITITERVRQLKANVGLIWVARRSNRSTISDSTDYDAARLCNDLSQLAGL